MGCAYILAFSGTSEEPADFWHPCFYAEDLSKSEVNILQQVMEKEFGYCTELYNEVDSFVFEVSDPTTDAVRFVGLRAEWKEFLHNPRMCHNSRDIDMLQAAAGVYADQIREIRPHLSQCVYLLADFGGGEGKVFNCVDCLTDQEINILEELLVQELHERGGIFSIVSADQVAVDDPAYYIRLKREWEWFSNREPSSDTRDRSDNAREVSEAIIEDIKNWREQYPGVQVQAPESEEEKQEQQPPLDDDRLIVSPTASQVSIDGTAYALKEEAAKLLRQLVEAKDWVSGGSIVNQPSRVVAGMPNEVRRWIESAPGKGYRIRTPE